MSNEATQADVAPPLAPTKRFGSGTGGYQPPIETGVNQSLPDGLYKDVDPSILIQRETPIHRRIQELHVEGFSILEIAGIVERSPQNVKTILRQPWARARMIERVNVTVNDQVKNFLESEVMPSLQRIKSIRDGVLDDPTNPLCAVPKSTQLAAGVYLTDRLLGKPNQPTSGVDVKPAEKQSDAELATSVKKILNLVGVAAEPSSGGGSPESTPPSSLSPALGAVESGPEAIRPSPSSSVPTVIPFSNEPDAMPQ